MIKVFNVPQWVVDKEEEGFMVVRNNGEELWYYGYYKDHVKAMTCAKALANAMVVEATQVEPLTINKFGWQQNNKRLTNQARIALI